MKQVPTCVVLSQDLKWVQGLSSSLSSVALLRHVDSLSRLEGVLERFNPTVLLLDLRAEGAFKGLAEIAAVWPQTVILAFGVPRTDPLIEAERGGVYAAEDLEVDHHRLRSVVIRALDHLSLIQENQLLREEGRRAARLTENALSEPSGDQGQPMTGSQLYPGALRRFDNVEGLVQSLVEDVSGSLMVSRVGIFCRSRDGQTYRLRAGLRCLEDAQAMEYQERDPLVRWLALHAHVVSRANLEHVKDASARLLLMRTLDELGAEEIVPLQARDGLLGWLFVGHLATGLPFTSAHLQHLVRITDCVCTTLENALLYEEIALQKTLAETLLHAMPSGIVAVDEQGIIRWFNDAAQQMLDVAAGSVLARPAETLDSRFADVLRRTLRSEGKEQSGGWTDPRLKRTFSVSTRRLRNGAVCLGAMAVIEDLTFQRMLEEKQEQLDRVAFWNDLAAALSHEIRNPLVAIKAFAQLLPERYTDPEFQNEFKQLVTSEVDRLNSLIDQIDNYAHPPKQEFKAVDLRVCLKTCVERIVPQDPQRGFGLRTQIPDDLPAVWGDERALTNCFAHILTNSMEALSHHEGKEIVVVAEALLAGDSKRTVEITFRDSGPGIPADLLDKVFSPFCTTKARGLGLGLPIVKRTVADHNGRVQIRSNARGTRVTLSLPAATTGILNETRSDS